MNLKNNVSMLYIVLFYLMLGSSCNDFDLIKIEIVKLSLINRHSSTHVSL